ncbi:hypothetical protein LZG74_19480 [Dyadobacter sp. CY327]|uniref:hypothetical protein n=1 Tax=Dyadobacter sp. CY327 TaxID=2907301 RepID=UPI001F475C71|nr:hypothetical protein [Dyadobacter sp. CY327]MCE7072508.1 hypothetical protein [Dyadobacter sp. CY327]
MENGQARASSLDHLDHCCRLVSEMYGKSDIGSWTNSDYVRLGYILYKKTNVQISPNTLKRIFGKIKTDVRYYPQKATRDALAGYVGYGDWEKFVSEAPRHAVVTKDPVRTAQPYFEAILPDEPILAPVRKRRKMSSVYIGLILAVFIAAVAFASYELFFSSPAPVNAALVCQNPVGENPHSAAFVVRGIPESYDVNKEHYTIDFGDGRRISLIEGDSLYSHYYEVPGRYSAILKRNGVTLDTASVYLKTNGWTATAKMMYDTTRVYPIDIQNLLTRDKKSVSALEVSRAGIDTNRTFFVDFINTQRTDIDADNFELFIKLNTSAPRAGVRCSQVRVTVFGESSKHVFDVMKPGCTHWTDLQFSEVTKPGELNQLNFLGVDLHTGGTVTLKVVDKHVRLFINAKEVFETNYKKPLKQIYGLGISFSGIGAIDSVMLKDVRTGKSFAGNF